MSLQVWLPMTKDLRQQGLSDLTFTNYGSTYLSTNGKLGGCYSFSGAGTAASNEIASTQKISISGDASYSIAFWFYWDGDSWSNDYVGVVGFGGQTTAGGAWGCLYNGRPDLDFWNCRYISPTQLSVKTWYHIAFTKQSGTGMGGHIYVNGVEVAGSSVGSYTPNIVSNRVIIGRLNSAMASRSFKGKINDVRIYDHCLSPMEVKQLSQGLVLHYPLNREGWGQENLLKNSHIKLDNNGYYVGTYSFANSEEIVTGETYTLSFNGELQDDSQTGWYFNIFPSPYTVIINKSTDREGRFAFSFVMPENNGNHTAIGCYSTPLGNRLGCAIWNVKLEKGSTPTPWCPNSSDMLATTMGLNSITEYDCSGFCNNGARTGTFTWTSDTPKYAVSQYFNGSSYIESTPLPPETKTISLWVKVDTLPTINTLLFADYNGSTGSGMALGFFQGTYFITGTTSANYARLGNTIKNGEWNHICIIKTGTHNRNVYVNGTLLTNEGSNSWSHNATQLWIGARKFSSNAYFTGQISDFRAYATALSVDDIKNLYQNSAYINSNGITYAHEFMET